MTVDAMKVGETATMEERLAGLAAGNAWGGEVIKSVEDKRLYRTVLLPNGLRAILVHDPEIVQGGNGEGEDAGQEEADDEEGSGEDDEAEDDDEDDGSEEDGSFEDDESEEEEKGHGKKECGHKHAEGEKCSGVHDDDEGDSAEEDMDEDDEDGGKEAAPMAATKKAAAAMCVNVGTFSDPEEANGLAHFLEHMLFMGSTKYPDENDYDAFLSKHGGGSNAFTETEHTVYHFDVSHKFLKPALDRFAQFFIAPLIKEGSMNREVQAVDSEFNQVLQSDSCRMLQIQCSTADPSHAFHKFSWGNAKSLSEPQERGVDMNAKLWELYKEHYKAAAMCLAVLGGETLDVMEEWVRELFGGVRPGGEIRPKFGSEKRFWESGKMYCMESVKDQHMLTLTWALPCLKSAYLKKPSDYISHLIGHEGAGSLLSLLKEKKWATCLSAGVGEGGYDRSTAGFMFSASIFLTKDGLDKVLDVVGVVYQYLKMVRSVGPQEWVFRELKDMAEMEFRFAEEESPDNYSVRLAQNMLIFPPEHTIFGDYVFSEWDPELVTDVLNRFTPENMRIDVLTITFDKKQPGIKMEPWFQVPYIVKDIPADVLHEWADPPSVDSALHMPPPNEYIPHDFSIRADQLPLPEPATNGAAAASANGSESLEAEPPQVIFEDGGMKLWYKLDRSFRTPRANVYFCITSAVAYESVASSVHADVLVKLLEDSLNETIYLANVAKLESALTPAAHRVELKIYGFNDKLPLLAKFIFSSLKSFAVRPDRFEVVKEELERNYRNRNIKPLKQAKYLRLLALKQTVWQTEDKLQALLSCTPAHISAFLPRFLGQMHVEVLVHGNMLEGEARSLVQASRDILAPNELPPALRPHDRIVQLPAGKSFLHNAKVKNDAEENSVVEMYFQGLQDVGDDSVKERSLVDLFEHIIYEPVYNQLRTKEQLGYRVDCGTRLSHGVLGFCFVVQSAVYDPKHLHERIDAFIASFREYLVGLPEDEFKAHREALISQKLQKDHSLMDESDRHWEQIWEQRYVFDMRRREATVLAEVTRDEVVAWYDRHLAPSSPDRKKLTIQVWGASKWAKNGPGAAKPEDNGDVVISDILEFKKQLSLFPLPSHV